MAKKVLYKRSSVVTEGIPKKPDASGMTYGEIAVNFADGYETMFLKNNQNEIVSFSSDEKFNTQITGISQSINELSSVVTSHTQSISSICDTLEDSGFLTEHQSLSGLAASVLYDSNTKRIKFFDKDSTELSTYVDASDFIKDGMVDTAFVSGSNLTIRFNTDAGKEDVLVPLSDIFNPTNYYTSAQTQSAITSATQNFVTSGDVETQITGHGYTNNVGTITGINMNGVSKGTSGVVDLGTVITSHQDISGKENTTNKVTSITSGSTNTQYASAKAVWDLVDTRIGNIDTLLNQIINGS